MDYSFLNHLSYTQDHLNQIEAIEKELVFSRFNSQDAFDLGNIILEISKEYKEDIAIIMIRESDQLAIFQYVMDSKSKKNIDYAYLKRNSVIETGHCSFWKLVNGFVNKQSIENVFTKTSLPIGGAFPIHVNNQLIATLAISGLHNGLDHELIIKSLCRYLKKDVCEFTGILL